MAYKTLVGLEIHVELSTKTKIFCGCSTEFGNDANTQCCPVCLGLPGALPVLNKSVVEYAIKAGIAFNCNIANRSSMDRKNYFYPDLVKGFQITQNDIPLCSDGYIEIETEEGPKRIGLMRIHIEEDTGKAIHTEEGGSLLDYNRCGVPLIEIVSKPDMNSKDEAQAFLDALKSTLQYIEVSDCKMEEGSLRCDVNLNVVDEEKGVKSKVTEIKNLNSFSAVGKAIEYEEKRHTALLEEGNDTSRETRRWNEVENETLVMRTKSEVADYRYVTEPDIGDLEVEEEWIEDIRNNMPELPQFKRARFIKEYDIPEYDAGVLTQSKDLSVFFEETAKLSDDPKQVSNWVMGDVLRFINDEGIELGELKFSPKELAQLLKLINDGKISNNIGKKVLKIMFETGKKPDKIIEEEGLTQISDEGELKEIVSKIIDDNPQSVEDFKDGKDKAKGFLIGQVMKETRGKANPQLVNKLVEDKLKER